MEGRGVDAGHGTCTRRQIGVNPAGRKVMEMVGGTGERARWPRKNRYRKSFEGKWGRDER